MSSRAMYEWGRCQSMGRSVKGASGDPWIPNYPLESSKRRTEGSMGCNWCKHSNIVYYKDLSWRGFDENSDDKQYEKSLKVCEIWDLRQKPLSDHHRSHAVPELTKWLAYAHLPPHFLKARSRLMQVKAAEQTYPFLHSPVINSTFDIQSTAQPQKRATLSCYSSVCVSLHSHVFNRRSSVCSHDYGDSPTVITLTSFSKMALFNHVMCMMDHVSLLMLIMKSERNVWYKRNCRHNYSCFVTFCHNRNATVLLCTRKNSDEC